MAFGAAPEGSLRDQKPAPKGAVALLQEFVQCSREFAAPQNRAILQWSYDQQMASAASLHFRATVAFVLDGVPHHVVGGWQPSKKLAQKDVAERTLRFFVGKWGQQLLEEDAAASAAPETEGSSEVEALEQFCRSFALCGGDRPRWTRHHAGRQCTSHLEVLLLGVPHKFEGAARPSSELADADVARRVLWYLQCPGYEAAFAPDPQAPAVSGKRIPDPPQNWTVSSSRELDDLRKAERKTSLMRVQNRLQQLLARALRAGESVWEWSYEMGSEDGTWPPMYRATVEVPMLGRAFLGAWARGQRAAQVEASLLVAEHLDRAEPSTSGGSGGGSVEGSDEGVEQAVRWADLDDED